MTKEEMEGLLEKAKSQIKEKQDALEKAQAELKTANESKAEATALKALEDRVKAAEEAANVKQAQIDTLETQIKMQGMGGQPNRKNAIEEVVEKNIENIKAVFTKGQKTEFTLKADFTTASVASSTIAMRDPNISPLAHRSLTMYDIFNKIPVSADQNGTVRYIDWDTATTARAAAAVAEGGTFPESTAKFTERTLTLEKIGDTIPITEEAAYDSQRFAAELRPFLMQNVSIVVDTYLLDGNSDPQFFGLDGRANAYTAAAAGIADPSVYDLAVKVKSDIKTNKGNKYNPNVLIMNQTTADSLLLKKDSQNNYVRPPFVQEVNGQIYVNGMLVIVNDNVDDNVMYAGDSRYGTIYESAEGFSITVGEPDSQFLEDMKTLKARKRMNLLIKNSEQDAWRKVSSISAALTTLAS